MIFIYCDGASRGNPGPASYGVSIVDSHGTVIAEFGEKLGVRTNNYAEYQGVIAALRYLSGTDFREITIRMDSKLVIEQLSGRWKVKSLDMRELVAEASRLLGPFDATLEWIPREQNSRADELANQALDGEVPEFEAAEIELAGIQPRSIRAPRQTDEPVTLVLVRHGHTKMTERDLIAGGDGDDPELSELGLLDAQAAASVIPSLLEFFKLPEAAEIIHSPMVRTTQTAQAISRELSLPLRTDERLREIGFGSWNGREMTAINSEYPELVRSWQGSMTVSPENGESIANLVSRISPLVKELAETQSGKTVVLVSHMMPVRTICALSAKGADSLYWGTNFSPGSVSIVRFFGTDFAEQFVINSCQHLFSD
jgi:ribonuclease H / adenosylcobalamin/alpha-ribazole phosphatase